MKSILGYCQFCAFVQFLCFIIFSVHLPTLGVVLNSFNLVSHELPLIKNVFFNKTPSWRRHFILFYLSRVFIITKTINKLLNLVGLSYSQLLNLDGLSYRQLLELPSPPPPNVVTNSSVAFNNYRSNIKRWISVSISTKSNLMFQRFIRRTLRGFINEKRRKFYALDTDEQNILCKALEK